MARGFALLLIGLGWSVAAAAEPAAVARPNVLILHADQLRADCLGFAGNPDVKTPNIDQLTRDGVR